MTAGQSAADALEQLQRLQLVTDGALAHLVPDVLPGALLSRIQAVFDSDVAAVLLVEEAASSLVRIAAVGLGDQFAGSIPLGCGFAGRVAAERRIIAVEDLAQCELASPLLAEQGVRAVLGAPLIVHDRLVGVVCVGMRHPYCFPDHQAALLEAVAQRIAPAIEMRRLYQELERAVELRDHVLAVVAHDLRGPLAAIQGYAQLFRGRTNDLAEMQRLTGYMRRIEQTTMVMSGMLQELLDVTRLQFGQTLTLDRTEGDLKEVVQAVVAEERARTTRGRDRIVFVAGPEALVGIWDLPRLGRVVRNLIENALRYTPNGGGIRLELAREENGGQSWAVLTVHDHGLGIPSADLPHVFDLFRRGANVETTIAGTGIGLTSARHIVEQHGGSIGVDSREGEGTTVTVRLPLLALGDLFGGRAMRGAGTPNRRSQPAGKTPLQCAS